MGYATHALASGFVSQQHNVILLLYFPSPFFLGFPIFLSFFLPCLFSSLFLLPPPLPACFPTLFHIVDLFPRVALGSVQNCVPLFGTYMYFFCNIIII